jgi:iron complex outermembrane receptor protein
MIRTADRSPTSELILVALLAFARIEPAHAQTKDFNVPAQSATTGIPEFARQAGIQILVSEPLVRGKRIAAVTGSHSVDEALAILLKGTGLAATSKDGATYTVTAGSPAPTSRNSSANEGQASTAATVEKQDEQASKKKPVQLEEVIVTGSRIPIAARQQQVQPVRSYTREDIARSGQTTMGEFLNTLPDVSNFADGSLKLGFAGMQTVQLHGLPVGTTLTLLDGRRLETNILGLFDLSNIPVSAVERIEILPVGASAIYGADALAGAVNTILRKDFNGFEANATVEHAGGVTDTSGSLAWGRRWERGSLSLVTDYQERGELLGTQREPTSLTHFPADFPVLALGNDTCAPGNVYSLDPSSNLPGLSSAEAGIPAGITGVPTQQQFAATAGKLNVCNATRYHDITPQSQREGALLSAHFQVAESVDLFAEFLFSHRYLRDQVGPQIQVSQSFFGTVAADNPYNPFGQAVNVSFVYPGAGQQEAQSTSLIRPMIGVRGAVFSEWHYEATAYLSRDRMHDVDVPTDFQKVSNALLSSDPATALNPFTSGAPGTPQLLSSLLQDPAAGFTDFLYDDRIVNVQGILRGPVLHLPAGALEAVIGSEYSQDKQDTIVNGVPPLFLHRNGYAIFSEARIPLLAVGGQPQHGERLTLTLAGRYDHSSDFGGKATWQSGLLWRATETLSLTGSYGQSYRAPQLSEISGPQATFADSFIGGIDPFRGNEPVVYPLTIVAGPNFNLQPETGNSSTLTLAYSSEAQHGLRASLSWYDLKISNYIGTQNTQAILDHPELFPGAVIRAPATPADQQKGFLGLITQFDSTFYNFGDLHVDGFDADVSYAIDTPLGQFTPSLAIANIYKWKSALLPDTPAIDAVSQATFFGVGWAPRWKGTAALAWKRGPLAMNVAGRYLGRYRDYQEIIPNTNELGNSWIIDASARYEAAQALAGRAPWLAGSYVTLGAVNLFNKTPPFSFTPFWYDIKEYDIRGRFLHLNVGVRF